jgi:prenyltransferase beta subunit
MSWQLASFLILGAVLLGGFAWYERSRPPSQVVALVAALAALAIAGRIAFAAFPNVKPTTDIVVFAGYALGPAPGFAVGALTGLVSNFWFGQGPWTPWQMAGWGLCGLLGAALALGGRNAGRLTLAATCGFAGIAYGLLLNFSLMATYGGDLSIQRFLTLEARAIPFDAAHAIGNVAFALLAGPAMVRMLVRFRERFQWRTPAVVTALLVVLVLPAVVPASADAAGSDSAATWLQSQQNADGGFGTSPGSDSTVVITGWAMLGLEATGRNPLDVARSGRSPVDYLRSNVDQATSAGDLARTILALEGAGVDPRDFGGRNLVSELAKRRAPNGSFVGWPGSTAYSVIALRTAGATGGLEQSLSWLGKVQNDDGGWGDVPGQPSNADVTGAVMQAMPGSKVAQRGLAYLRNHQRSSGGFAGGSGEVNSQSTSWAAQGMIAVGADPADAGSGGKKSPLEYLGAQQAPDGHYSYSASSDQTPVWVTAEALVAAAGASLPVPPPARQANPVTAPSSAGPAGVGVAPVTPAPAPELPPGALPSQPGAGGGSSAPPLVPKGTLPTPKAGGESPGTEALPPEAESPAPQPVAAKGTEPSAEAAVGIGLAGTALAIGAPWWLGRRNGW